MKAQTQIYLPDFMTTTIKELQALNRQIAEVRKSLQGFHLAQQKTKEDQDNKLQKTREDNANDKQATKKAENADA